MPLTLAINTTAVADGEISDKASIPLTFTASESTSNFAAGDISVTNGTITSFAGNGKSYTATLTPTAPGAVTVTVDAASFSDADSNDNEASSFTYTYKLPTVTMSVTDHAGEDVLGRGTFGPYTATFSFSQAPLSFALTDILVTNGTASALGGSGATRTATITPTSNHYGAMAVTLSNPGKSKASLGDPATVDWTNTVKTMEMSVERLGQGYRYYAGSLDQEGDSPDILLPVGATQFTVFVDNSIETDSSLQSTLVIQSSISTRGNILKNEGAYLTTGTTIAHNAKNLVTFVEDASAVRIKSQTGKNTTYAWELHVGPQA